MRSRFKCPRFKCPRFKCLVYGTRRGAKKEARMQVEAHKFSTLVHDFCSGVITNDA